MQTGQISVAREKDLVIDRVDQEWFRFVSMLDDVATDTVSGHEESVHRMRLSGQVHGSTFELREVRAEFEVVPHDVCELALASAIGLNGLRIGPGFRRSVIDLLGNTAGCTHLLSMAVELSQMHTLVTYARMREQLPSEEHTSSNWVRAGLEMEPRMEGACVALRSDSPVVIAARTGARGEDTGRDADVDRTVPGELG